MSTLTGEEAMAYVNMARQYQKAGSRLLDSVESEKRGNQIPLSDPIYLLYFHTVELALKAFLLYYGQTVPRGQAGHDIVELHKRCDSLGLRLNDDPQGLRNIVTLLASGNDDHGFRYFNLKSSAIPDLHWTRDVVDSLIQVVRARVDSNAPPGPAVKVQVLVGKPREKTS